MEKIKTNELRNCDAATLAKAACAILLEKKALDVKMFCVKETTNITDYYINATGRSSTQVAALADELVDNFSDRGRNSLRVEGREGGAWILVDYGDLIVNVFDKASREFYNLDRHLPEDSIVDISDLEAEVDAKFDINKN